jgi:hypothetical protein
MGEDDKPLPPNLAILGADLRRLVATGHAWAKVEDVFIGSSGRNAQLYLRPVYEFWQMPRLVREGNVMVGTGVFSTGRRSVEGFREFIRQEATP